MYTPPATRECSPISGTVVLANGVEDEVVGLAVRGEVARAVIRRVVDHVVCAERAHHARRWAVLQTAVNAGAHVFGQLHARSPDSTRTLRRLDHVVSGVYPGASQTIERVDDAVAHRCGFVENQRLPGMEASGALCFMHMYSAWAPNLSGCTPKTRSPIANSVTADPIASIVPATSLPRICSFGRRRPLKKRTNQRLALPEPDRSVHGPVEWTRIRTWLCARRGYRHLGSARSTSGGSVACVHRRPHRTVEPHRASVAMQSKP